MGLSALALLVVLFLAAGAWFLYHPPGSGEDAPAPEVRPSAVMPTPVNRGDVVAEVGYPGRDGATVLELLKEDHQVRLDSELLLFGAIVLEIDTITARPDEFWIFYRDTTRGDRPPDECTTKTGEWIRWVLKPRR
jgi:hypothetical protein